MRNVAIGQEEAKAEPLVGYDLNELRSTQNENIVTEVRLSNVYVGGSRKMCTQNRRRKRGLPRLTGLIVLREIAYGDHLASG